jgi:hypothetical protein
MRNVDPATARHHCQRVVEGKGQLYVCLLSDICQRWDSSKHSPCCRLRSKSSKVPAHNQESEKRRKRSASNLAEQKRKAGKWRRRDPGWLLEECYPVVVVRFGRGDCRGATVVVKQDRFHDATAGVRRRDGLRGTRETCTLLAPGQEYWLGSPCS